MAAKATTQDIEDAGFRATQFGTPADWTLPETGYLARLINTASIWAQSRFGAAYSDVTKEANPTTFERLRQAELCYIRSELWKRRAAFIDSNAVSALENLAYLDRRAFEEQAARAWECAEDWMARAIGDADAVPGTAAVLTHAVSGPFVEPEGWPA